MKAQTKRTSSPRVESLEGRALLSPVSGVSLGSDPTPAEQISVNFTRVVTWTDQVTTRAVLG